METLLEGAFEAVEAPYRLGQIGIVGNSIAFLAMTLASLAPYRLGQIGIVGNYLSLL